MSKGKDKKSEEKADEAVLEYEDEGESAKDTLKKLRERLKKCEEEKQEYLKGWQRAKADMINAKREEERSKEELRKFAKEDILADLVTAIDTFEIAFANKDVWERIDENWRHGIEHIYKELVKISEKHGLSQIDPYGEAFDPTLHEPVALVPTNDKKNEGIIMKVIQKGYALNGKVIRPARVNVGSLKRIN